MTIRPVGHGSAEVPSRPAPAVAPRDTVSLGQEAPPRLIPRPAGPLQETARSAEATDLASKMLVGPQRPAAALRDLEAVPLPWLRRLSDEGLIVAVVGDGQSLADTPALVEMTPERCRRGFPEARRLAAEAVARAEALLPPDGGTALDRYWLPDQVREGLLASLNEAGLGFSVEIAREPVDLARLAASKNVSDPAEWTGLLAELNEGLATVDGGRAEARHGVLLVPYVEHRGRAVSEVSKASYGKYDGMAMRMHRGMHYWPSRLLAVHEVFAKAPADEVGHYRVLVHEVGHAIDYAAESLFPEHRQTVDRLFEADRAAARFLTDRAADNAREYFAEAVEAWMTRRVGDDQDFYKAQNSREDLARRNPELFAYVDRLLRS